MGLYVAHHKIKYVGPIVARGFDHPIECKPFTKREVDINLLFFRQETTFLKQRGVKRDHVCRTSSGSSGRSGRYRTHVSKATEKFFARVNYIQWILRLYIINFSEYYKIHNSRNHNSCISQRVL